jgi:hypothetical protein
MNSPSTARGEFRGRPVLAFSPRMFLSNVIEDSATLRITAAAVSEPVSRVKSIVGYEGSSWPIAKYGVSSLPDVSARSRAMVTT